MSKRSKRQAGPDWSLRPRGTVAATVQGTIGLAAVAAAGHAAEVSPVLGALGAAGGALGTVLVSAAQDAPPAALAYRLACWVGAGGWLTYTLFTTPWTVNTMAGMAAGAVVAGVCAPLARFTPRRTGGAEGTGPGTEVVLSGGGELGREWQRRIARVCRVNVVVTEVRDWPTRTGYDVHVDLPIGGATVDDIARHAKGLAVDARLPRGCKVEVTEGGHQGRAVLRVATVNRLLEEVPFELAADRVRSILDGVEVGEFPDGSPVRVPLREETVLAVGKTGSGKTNLLDLFTCRIGQCADALVWHIDLNGGGMSWSWLQPWLRGETDRPAVDWAAPTAEEAFLLVQVAYAIGLDRKGSAHHLKAAANVRLMPISASLPEIVIVVDEGKKVLSSEARGLVADIRDLLTVIQDELRDAGVRIVTSALRATSTVIDPDFKSQVGVKIGMRVEKDAELAYLHDWDAGLKVSDLPVDENGDPIGGCAYIQFGQSTPRMWRAAHIRPADIEAAAVAIARNRPDLDRDGQAIGGQIYADRLTRMREYFGRMSSPDAARSTGQGTAATTPAGAAAPTSATSATMPATRPRLHVVNGGASTFAPTTPAPTAVSASVAGDANAWPDPGDLVATAAAAPDVATNAAAWPDPSEIMAAAAVPYAAATAAPARPTTAHTIPANGHAQIPAGHTSATSAAAAHQDGQGGPATAADRGQVPELLARLAQVFAELPEEPALHTELLTANLGAPITAKRLAALLGPLGVQPIEAFHMVDRTVSDGKRRGYRRADVLDAIDAIRVGRIIPPRELRDWPAT